MLHALEPHVFEMAAIRQLRERVTTACEATVRLPGSPVPVNARHLVGIVTPVLFDSSMVLRVVGT